MCGYVHMSPGVWSPQKGLGPLELELQAVVSCLIWRLETKLGSLQMHQALLIRALWPDPKF